MKINPYICLNGNCAEAMAFYEDVFQAKNLGVMRFGDAKNMDHPIPDEARDLIMHGAIEFEGNRIMFSDAFPGQAVTPGDVVTLSIVTDSIEKTTSIYHALAKDGEVTMELQKTFWSPAFGMLCDKFGISWQVSTELQ